jgi:hypothetical protein
MKTRLALLLMGMATVAAVHALGGAPPVPARVDFATLSFAEAQQVQGRRARFHVVLDSDAADRGGCVVYDCRSRDDALRTV